MLQLKEYDLTPTNVTTNTTTNMLTNINTKEVKIKKNQLYDNKCFKVGLFALISSLVLSVGLIVFSFLHFSNNATFLRVQLFHIPIIISSIITGLFVALLILTSHNKFTLLKPTKILLCIASVLLIFIFVTSLIDSFCYDVSLMVYECEGYNYYLHNWEDYVPSGNCRLDRILEYRNMIEFPILVTIISAILIAIDIILIVKTTKIKEPIIVDKNKVVKEKIKISPIEHEINNIKSLMDKGVIDEEEYKTLRKGIIEKYSKN